jgi:hypothetical protein
VKDDVIGLNVAHLNEALPMTNCKICLSGAIASCGRACADILARGNSSSQSSSAGVIETAGVQRSNRQKSDHHTIERRSPSTFLPKIFLDRKIKTAAAICQRPTGHDNVLRDEKGLQPQWFYCTQIR